MEPTASDCSTTSQGQSYTPVQLAMARGLAEKIYAYYQVPENVERFKAAHGGREPMALAKAS